VVFGDTEAILAVHQEAVRSSMRHRDEQERRLAEITESKFLGGDLHHTHLVKGLDYALLDKARADLAAASTQATSASSTSPSESTGGGAAGPSSSTAAAAPGPEAVKCVTRVAAGVMDVLFHRKPPVRNELFTPGRMAFLFELEGSSEADTDIVATLVRSKAELSETQQSASVLTTHDIVVSKLIQILAALRVGARKTKRAKPKQLDDGVTAATSAAPKPAAAAPVDADLDMFGDVLPPSKPKPRETVPAESQPVSAAEAEPTTEAVEALAARGYFSFLGVSAAATEEGEAGKSDVPAAGGLSALLKSAGVSAEETTGKAEPAGPASTTAPETREAEPKPGPAKLPRRALFDPTAEVDDEDGIGVLIGRGGEGSGGLYAEAYAGANDSDEEDYSKMDKGTKKSKQLSRFDFETDEAYEEYQSKREAIPKCVVPPDHAGRCSPIMSAERRFSSDKSSTMGARRVGRVGLWTRRKSTRCVRWCDGVMACVCVCVMV
jgi:IK cytokine